MKEELLGTYAPTFNTVDTIPAAIGEWVKNGGHNWVTRQAFKTLKNIGLLPEGIDERNVHYGVLFADYPYLGPLETMSPNTQHGKCVPSIREDLYGKRPVSASQCLELRYPWSSAERPNLYLNARFVVSYVVGSERFEYAVDNFCHYPHNDQVKLDGCVLDFTDAIVRGPKGKGNWNIKGSLYANELFALARKFKNPAKYGKPSLKDLKKINSPGQVRNTGGALPTATKEVPVTYLGGNPFILTAEGTPTWPIWVSDYAKGYKVQDLIANNPPKSDRIASIYLGWGLHYIHDLCHPYHAKDLAGKCHTYSEGILDELIQDGVFDHLPTLAALAWSTKYKYAKREPYWELYINDLMNGSADVKPRWDEMVVESIKIYPKFHDMVKLLRQEEDDHGREYALSLLKKNNEWLGYFEYMLDMAIKNSMFIIAHIN